MIASSTPQKERLPNDRTQEFNEITLDRIVVRWQVKGYFIFGALESLPGSFGKASTVRNIQRSAAFLQHSFVILQFPAKAPFTRNS
jgi:hypothetical protein